MIEFLIPAVIQISWSIFRKLSGNVSIIVVLWDYSYCELYCIVSYYVIPIPIKQNDKTKSTYTPVFCFFSSSKGICLVFTAENNLNNCIF